MQTIRDHKEAKTITREEFEDILKVVHQQVLQKIRDSGEHWEPLYSWDHTNLHEDIAYPRVGFRENQRVKLGVKAPDMHQVIEHVFGAVKRNFMAQLYRVDFKITGASAQKLCREVSEQTINKEGIKSNLDKLPLLYKIIATAKDQQFTHTDGKRYLGVGGDWAQKRHR